MQPMKPLFKVLPATPLLAACLSAAVFFMAQVESIRPFYAQWDKAAHLICFFALWWAFRMGLQMGRGAAFVLAASLGALIEVHQMGHPQFHPSWADFFADLAGIGLAWTTSLCLPARKDPP